MSGHRQYKITDYRFGQLVLGLRDKIGLTQQVVADALSVSRRTVQHWEAGSAFPDSAHLKSLIEVFLQHGAFNPGKEQDEAVALWAQADESAARRRSLFDEAWFDGLLHKHTEQPSRLPHLVKRSPGEAPPAAPHLDWGDAPEVAHLYGRERELAELTRWVLADRCRLVTVLGMGGIGKTTLVVKFAQDYAGQFDYVIWRSLRNAPALPDLLLECLQILSPVHSEKPTIQMLVGLLEQHRCLLILDNAETLNSTGSLSGRYQEGYESYQRLFQTIAQTRHQSCLLLTSREMPLELEPVQGVESPVRVLKVGGLDSTASQALLTDKHLFGPSGAWDVFVHYYTGNPLALKIAAATVRDLFGGDLAAFLREAPVTLHTLNQLLGNQYEHLSALERELLFWMAIERDPVSLDQLRRNFLVEVSNSELLAGLLSLLQRSLIERSDQGAVFSMLPVLLEFVTDRLVGAVTDDLTSGNLETLVQYALMKSQSPDYIRESQVRMILQPALALLKRRLGGPTQPAEHLRRLLDQVRGRPRVAQGYAGGNLLNLLAHLNGDLRGEDFSRLALRQVYLQAVEAQDANFSGAEFTAARFTEPLESISAMMLSPSGVYLAASTFNGHMRCWDLADGKPLWTVTNAKRAWSMAFSPDETTLACSNYYGQVSLWDVATGRHLHTFEGHQAWVNAVAFDPTGRFLASAGIDRRVCIWDLEKLALRYALEGHTNRVMSLAYSPDGKLLVSGGYDENIHVWDPRKGALRRVIPQETKAWVNLAFHPNGKWIASCSEQDPVIRFWDVHTGERLFSLASRSNGPTALTFNPEGSLLINGGRDGSVELWDMTGPQPQYVKMLMGHHHYVSVIAYRQRQLLATLSYGEAIKIWNGESGRLLRVIEGFSRLIGANAFSPNGRLLYQGDSGGRIRVWDLDAHRYTATLQGHTGPIWAIAFSPDGKTLATSGDDRKVSLWDAASLQHLKTFTGHKGPIWTLAFSPDGKLLASGGSVRRIKIWDTRLEGGTQELFNVKVTEDVWSLAFDPGGETLASGDTNGAVVIWDYRSGQVLAILDHGAELVGGLRYSSDGKTLITSSNNLLLKFWAVEERASTRTVPAVTEDNRTKAVAIGRDGKLVATGGKEFRVYLWAGVADEDVQTLRPVILEGHTSRVWGMALSPDDRFLASSDEEGNTLLSDVAAGRVIEKIAIDRPYERMNVWGVTGLNAAERAALKALGAVEGGPEA